MRLKDNRHGTIKSAAQISLMITIKEEDLTLGLRALRILISNLDRGIRIIRINPDLASTQIETETQIQIDSITKTDQATLATMNQITVSKLNITSMLDQRTQTVNTTKTFPRATIYLHPTQFNSMTIRDKVQYIPYQASFLQTSEAYETR